MSKEHTLRTLIGQAIRRRPQGSCLDQAWYDAHPDRCRQPAPSFPPDVTLLLRVENEFICAGAVWQRKSGFWSCITTAPILAWMKRLIPLDAKFELLKRGFSYQFFPAHNAGELVPGKATVGTASAIQLGQT